MKKNFKVSYLLDFYGEVLSEKQRTAVEMYYNDDLSLSEIGDLLGISRQGVRDLVKRSESTLYDMEQKLGLAARFTSMHCELDKIRKNAEKIEHLNNELQHSSDIRDLANEIADIAAKLAE